MQELDGLRLVGFAPFGNQRHLQPFFRQENPNSPGVRRAAAIEQLHSMLRSFTLIIGRTSMHVAQKCAAVLGRRHASNTASPEVASPEANKLAQRIAERSQ